VSGVVRRPSGSPLAGARVGIRGTTAETVSDERGVYSLVDLPAGTQTLEARAIGFTPISRTITLSARRPLSFDVRFDSAAHVLETVEVTGKPVVDRATQEFNTAKKRGFGYFIDRERIEEQNAFVASDILRMAPGVTVTQSGYPGGGSSISMRGVGSISGRCEPGIVIDGMPVTGQSSDLDILARPDDIAGIAVYRGPGETPVEYQNLSPCGVIQIWTRRGNTPRGSSRK
ncbi:MAG: TonB-dependent receptor plug domain-containing protein, partial [Gemmatimonadaceae bacterium]|nr:TonB-dependent receptor plug domain-containing protein [Gemmatimonadaceae bacterium]